MAAGTGKKLRSGFTTGAAAAAAAKAGLCYLLGHQRVPHVELALLTGRSIKILIDTCRRLEDGKVQCEVIKDAGDDPDITHGARIGATVNFKPSVAAGSVRVTGGKGVGKVTKPGLETAPGHAAITSGPKKMITLAVEDVLERYHMTGQVEVEVYVPDGQILARKTLNARLGILGGISILGTTGEVRPLSHEAYLATIASSLSVARACGASEVVFTTGRRSERFAQNLWPRIAQDRFIQIGDFFAKSIQMAQAQGIESVTMAVFFGKAVKMSQAIAHTHARSADLRLKKLAQWAQEISSDAVFAQQVERANTARHAFDLIRPRYPELIQRVGKEVIRAAIGFSSGKLNVHAVIFDFQGAVCFSD
ncbi:MAG: cobalamin biosynthesis protein CbiD [Desulfobacteraceae bacterium]|nr:cobalamin biosynthesis protein CbiD [Desulfobacteraceae bacterium]